MACLVDFWMLMACVMYWRLGNITFKYIEMYALKRTWNSLLHQKYISTAMNSECPAVAFFIRISSSLYHVKNSFWEEHHARC